MNLLFPALGLGAWYIYSLQKDGERLKKCEIHRFKIGTPSIKLQETNIPVTLEIFNPNTRSLGVDYFRGIVKRGGLKLGDFSFSSSATILKGRITTPVTFNVRIPTTGILSNVVNIVKNLLNSQPIETTFTVDAIISMGGFDSPVKFSYDVKKGTSVSGIAGVHDESVMWLNIGKHGHKSSATIDGKRISMKVAKDKIIAGEYKEQARYADGKGLHIQLVKMQGTVGKPYAKYEFGSNDEMNEHFKKDCGKQKVYFSKN